MKKLNFRKRMHAGILAGLIAVGFTPLANFGGGGVFSSIATVKSVDLYTVTYDDNGATSGIVPIDPAKYSSIAVVLGNTGNLEKKGYSWCGWNTQADGNGMTYLPGETFAITENTTLYALWYINSAAPPTISSQTTNLNLTYGYTSCSIGVSANTIVGHTLSYQWYSNTTNSNSDGIAIPNANSASYIIPTGKNAGTTEYYYCDVISTKIDNGSASVRTSDVVILTVSKAALDKPDAPVKADATINSVTLKPSTDYQYKCGDGAWQESNVFTGLAMNTEYTFYQRVKGDSNHNDSPSSDGTVIKTHDHVHEWTYSAAGAVITATCADTDRGHGTPKTAALTIVAPTLKTCGGTGDANATITGSIAGVANPAIIYKKGTQILNKAPTNAGTYTANITLGGVTAAVEYSISVSYTVTVKNGTINGTSTGSYEPDKVLVAKADQAPAGYIFAYWKKNGATASYSANYTFPLSKNTELEAVYTLIADEFQIDGTDHLDGFIADKKNGTLQIFVLHSVANDCRILKAGLVATSNPAKLNNLTAENADIVRYQDNITVNKYKFTCTMNNVTADQAWYVRSYLEYQMADGTVKTVYGDLVQATLDGCKVQVQNKIVGTANIDDVQADKENCKLSFAALMNVPADCTIKFAGVVATSDASKVDYLNKIKATEKTMVNGCYVRGMTSKMHTVKFTWTKTEVTEDQTWYVRSYLVYVDANGNEQIVYGDLVTQKLN